MRVGQGGEENAVKGTQAVHPIYFLTTRKKGQNRLSLTSIKDERTGKCFACVFVSAADAEEFTVANGLTFGCWRVSEVESSVFVRSRCKQALWDGIYEAVINPPPLIRGTWRTLPIEHLVT